MTTQPDRTKSLHILIVPSWYPAADQPVKGIFCRDFAQSLYQHDVKVGVIYPDIRSLRGLDLRQIRERRFQCTKELEDGIPTFRGVGWNFLPRLRMEHRLWAWMAKRLMRRYIKEHGRPDVIHAHNALWAGHAAKKLSKAYRIPFVLTEHASAHARGLVPQWQRRITQQVQSAASVSTAVSTAFAKVLRPYRADIRVVPNSVNTEVFTSPTAQRESYPFVFTSIALLTENKGLDILLRAFAEAFTNEEVQLNIGGDGPHRRALSDLARELGIEERVHFWGLLTKQQVRDVLQTSNAFVLPSTFETFGIVLVEAMSTGLPVIATRCGGPEDIVTPETGILTPVGDITALSEALRQIHMNQENYNEREIREYAIQRFDGKVIVSQWQRIYAEAANKEHHDSSGGQNGQAVDDLSLSESDN